MRDLYDESEIRLDHLLTRSFIAPFDLGSELHFLDWRQQLHLADLAQIELNGSITIVRGAVALCFGRKRGQADLIGSVAVAADGNGRRPLIFRALFEDWRAHTTSKPMKPR